MLSLLGIIHRALYLLLAESWPALWQLQPLHPKCKAAHHYLRGHHLSCPNSANLQAHTIHQRLKSLELLHKRSQCVQEARAKPCRKQEVENHKLVLLEELYRRPASEVSRVCKHPDASLKATSVCSCAQYDQKS